MSLSSESKKLAMKLRAHEENYITGQFDLNETINETQRLWSEVQRKSVDDHITAVEIMPDSNLMKIQTGLAKRSAKFYKPDSLVFNPTEFSMKLKQYYDHTNALESNSPSSSIAEELIWLELGNTAKKVLYTVPSFHFMHGTFDPDPVEVVKKKRRIKEKDKVGSITRPISTNLKDSSDNKDPMIRQAERVLGIFTKLCQKNEDSVVCFYEFVTDPTSFEQTVENVFILSLLVKEGCVRIMRDRNGLPCISTVDDRRDRNPADSKQSIFSISREEWKDIVIKFNLKKPLITHRKTKY